MQIKVHPRFLKLKSGVDNTSHRRIAARNLHHSRDVMRAAIFGGMPGDFDGRGRFKFVNRQKVPGKFRGEVIALCDTASDPRGNGAQTVVLLKLKSCSRSTFTDLLPQCSKHDLPDGCIVSGVLAFFGHFGVVCRLVDHAINCVAQELLQYLRV